MIHLLFHLLSPLSFALDFHTYPVPRTEMECHPLDFRSSSQARHAEELLRKNNPDRSRANYAGKYLLLKVPYMMETEWLIADCASGKFYKETLSGEAEFRADSALIRVIRDRTPTWSHWTGETFVRLDDPNPIPGGGSSPDLLERRYARVFQEGRVSLLEGPCAKPDFHSYFRAQQSEGQIRKNLPDPLRPNFAGQFLLLQVDLLFETLQLIADCKTGKFLPEFKSGKMVFQKDSRVALLIRKDSIPEVLEWHAPEWVRKPDPTAEDPREVENELRGDPARTLLATLPNPLNRSRIEFKELQCRKPSADASPACSLEIDDPKASEKTFQVSGETAQKWLSVLERYGVKSGTASTGWVFAVRRGFCTRVNGACALFSR
jgi:hypothetical protein